jgi:hypothetical protein
MNTQADCRSITLRRIQIAKASRYTLKPIKCRHSEISAVKVSKLASLTQTENSEDSAQATRRISSPFGRQD